MRLQTHLALTACFLKMRWIGLLAMLLAVIGSHAQQPQQVSKSSEPAYLQALSPTERKDYEDLKADWEKQHKADPKGFKQLRARITLQSQMILGRFGYGTLFTGALDDRTQGALRAYQAKKGIPLSGEVDPITYYWLTRDDDAADKRVTDLPAFSLNFDETYAWADGAWDGANTSDAEVVGTHLECYNLGNHLKSGQRVSVQNRPTEGPRNLDVLPLHPLFRQVEFVMAKLDGRDNANNSPRVRLGCDGTGLCWLVLRDNETG